jgi:hypothetical protein
LDQEGKPLSSYWKHKLLTEAQESKIQELKGRIQDLRDLLLQKEEDSQDLVRQDLEVLSLEREVQDLKSSLRKRGESSQALIQRLQKEKQDLRKQARELEQSLERQKNLNQKLQLRITKSAKRDMGNGKNPVGPSPTIKDLFMWLGISLDPPRVLARGGGSDYNTEVEIELRGDYLARVTYSGCGGSRVFRTVPLSSPAWDLVDIFLPYRHYLEYETDSRVLAACRLLGKPLRCN